MPVPKKRASAAAKAANPFSGVPGGCRGARVVQGVSKLPPPASTAKAKPAARRPPAVAVPVPDEDAQPSYAEIMGAIASLTEKVSQLSGQQGSRPEVARRLAPPPGMPQASSAAASWMPHETAGVTAYGRTLAAARQVLGEAAGAGAPEPRGPARPRPSEDRIRDVITGGGEH
eukprot:490603-Amphidinium_carterae.1